jgi:hypothetical protein
MGRYALPPTEMMSEPARHWAPGVARPYTRIPQPGFRNSGRRRLALDA